MDVKVDFDFSDVDDFFNEGDAEYLDVVDKVGYEADEYDKENGSYTDRSGTLRKSNKHIASKEGLELYNDATAPNGYQYASKVESYGFEVRSGGALYAEKRLKEEFER